MAKKVTVSIPDILHEKMEKWRQSFNLSKMFQEAVAEAIQKKEDFQKRIQEDLDLAEVVERLRYEKACSEGGFFTNGQRDGIAWVKHAHYDDIMYALKWKDVDNVDKDKVLGEYFSGKIREIKEMNISSEGVNEYVRAYVRGWQKGLADFWDEIKAKL